MTTITKYPTVITDLDAWTNPNRAAGAHDGLCAYKNVVGGPPADYILRGSSLGFNIPADATIDAYYIGAHAFFDSASEYGTVTLEVAIAKPLVSIHHTLREVYGGGNFCVECLDSEIPYNCQDIIPMTPSDFNTENFQFEIWFRRMQSKTPYALSGNVDWFWIRVVYTEVVPYLGDGLTWIGKMARTPYKLKGVILRRKCLPWAV